MSEDVKTTKATHQQLSVVRLLYQRGIGQTLEHGDASGTSILAYHDALELFLRLTAEKTGLHVKKDAPFMVVWERVRTKLPKMESIDRLNAARVALKHSGLIPTKNFVDEVTASVTEFLKSATPKVFGSEFDAISLIDLVKSSAARKLLNEARERKESGDLHDSVTLAARAFHELWTIFRRENGVPSSGAVMVPHGTPSEWAAVIQAIAGLEDQIDALTFGINRLELVKFRHLVPHLQVSPISGKYQAVSKPRARPIERQDCEFCIRFVVDTALQLQHVITHLRG